MFERFTEPARDVVKGAQKLAREFEHPRIGTEHLLLGILAGDSPGSRVLARLGVAEDAVRVEVVGADDPDAAALSAIGIDLDAVQARAEETFGPGALDRSLWHGRRGRFGGGRGRHIPMTEGAKTALERSLRESLGLHHTYIGTEHLLLGVVTDPQERAPVILRRLGATSDVEAIRAYVREELDQAA